MLRLFLLKNEPGDDKWTRTINSDATLEDTNTYAKMDNPKKKIRPERGSQTDNEEQQQQDGVKLCFDKLNLIEEKLDKVRLKLEEEKQSMTECLQFMQEDLNDLKAKVESTIANLQEANKQLEKVSELERRQKKTGML